jgi:uncharacterized membrane protein
LLKSWRKAFLFCLGGGLYAALELVYRGRTYGSMFFLGGFCFLILGQLGRLRLSWPALTVLGAAAITAGELVTGLLCNRNYGIWDYRSLPFQFQGQICLQFSLLWLPLAFLGAQLYRGVESKLP